MLEGQQRQSKMQQDPLAAKARLSSLGQRCSDSPTHASDRSRKAYGRHICLCVAGTHRRLAIRIEGDVCGMSRPGFVAPCWTRGVLAASGSLCWIADSRMDPLGECVWVGLETVEITIGPPPHSLLIAMIELGRNERIHWPGRGCRLCMCLRRAGVSRAG